MRESEQARIAYALYEVMPTPRSLEKLHQQHPESTPKLRQLKEWSAAHGWQERVRSFDHAILDENAKREIAARIAEADKRRKARLGMAEALRGIGLKVITAWNEEDGIAPLVERPGAVVRMLDHADRTERLDTGEVTERHEVNVSGPIRFIEVVDPYGDGDSRPGPRHGSDPLPPDA